MPTPVAAVAATAARLTVAVAVVLLVAGGGCRSKGSSGGDSTDAESDALRSDAELCQLGCSATANVSCPDHLPFCVENCIAVLAAGPCIGENRAFLECTTAAGPSAWYCMNQQKTVLVAGVCTLQNQALAACGLALTRDR